MANNEKVTVWTGGQFVSKSRDVANYDPETIYDEITNDENINTKMAGSYFGGNNSISINRGKESFNPLKSPYLSGAFLGSSVSVDDSELVEIWRSELASVPDIDLTSYNLINVFGFHSYILDGKRKVRTFSIDGAPGIFSAFGDNSTLVVVGAKIGTSNFNAFVGDPNNGNSGIFIDNSNTARAMIGGTELSSTNVNVFNQNVFILEKYIGFNWKAYINGIDVTNNEDQQSMDWGGGSISFGIGGALCDFAYAALLKFDCILTNEEKKQLNDWGRTI